MDILTPHDDITNEKICKAQIEAVEKKQNEYKLIGRLMKIPGTPSTSLTQLLGKLVKWKCELI